MTIHVDGAETDVTKVHLATAAAVAAALSTALPLVGQRFEQQRSDRELGRQALEFRAHLVTGEETAPAVVQRMASAAIGAQFGELRLRGRMFEAHEAAPRKIEAADVQVASSLTREKQCLAEAIFYEARSETRLGQFAVAEVIKNRVRSPLYPNSICGVVYQGSHRSTGCQFSFTCDGSMKRRPRGEAWREAQEIASLVIQGLAPKIVAQSTHYHTVDISPYWSASLVRTAVVGAHVFYRFPNRAERATLAAAQAAALAELETVEAVSQADADGAEGSMIAAAAQAPVEGGVGSSGPLPVEPAELAAASAAPAIPPAPAGQPSVAPSLSQLPANEPGPPTNPSGAAL